MIGWSWQEPTLANLSRRRMPIASPEGALLEIGEQPYGKDAESAYETDDATEQQDR